MADFGLLFLFQRLGGVVGGCRSETVRLCICGGVGVSDYGVEKGL